MQVGVVYSEPGQQVWLNLEVPDESTVVEAIERSGILKQFPHVALAERKLGIFWSRGQARRRAQGRRPGGNLPAHHRRP